MHLRIEEEDGAEEHACEADGPRDPADCSNSAPKWTSSWMLRHHYWMSSCARCDSVNWQAATLTESPPISPEIFTMILWNLLASLHS